MVKEKTETYTDWYALWAKQSQAFFDSANKNLKLFLDQGPAFKPEENRELINNWLESLKTQWEKIPLTDEQKAYANYWTKMAKMFNDASNKMVENWIHTSQTGNPVKSIPELYELWLRSCQEAYSKSLNSQTQEAFTDFMNQAFKFWKDSNPTKE